MSAALLPRPALTCRSRQLYDAFSLPPMNHLAHGESHSRTFFQGLNQSSSLAALAQKALGSFRAWAKTRAFLILADFLKALGGGKVLFSWSRTSIGLSAMAVLLFRRRRILPSYKAERILFKHRPDDKGPLLRVHPLGPQLSPSPSPQGGGVRTSRRR